MVEQILELQSAKGSNAKLSVMRKYREDNWFRMFLYYALNPLLTYNLSEATLRKKTEVDEEKQPLIFFNDIFECCEFLSRLRGIDDATVRQVKTLLYHYCTDEEREVYAKLLAKTLRLGVTAKTVNKAIPELIPEWEVQQAYPIDKYPVRDGTEFWLTQKLNGVRATLYRGQLIARSGQPYRGLDHILRAVGNWAQRTGLVLDGELTLKNKGELSDNEAFRMATGILNSDDEDKSQICYTIFDVVTVDDFENANPKVTYSNRRAVLDGMDIMLNTDCTSVLPVLYHGTDQRKIWELLEKMVAEDKEGLMLNTDVPYYRNRHKGILKVNPSGIFQFEGAFAFESLKRFVPKSIFDMSIVTACIRPSGSSYRDKLLARVPHKNPSEIIDELLSENLGYLIYQEDTIKFLQQICGLSGSEADNIRRAIGRKQRDRLEAALPSILEGYCSKSPQTREVAENEAKEFLQIIEDSASYQFGYNHSVAYCLLGYLCAYYRYYHPIEFITSFLNNAANEEDIRNGTAYANRVGIQVTMPKWGLSKSDYFFDKEKNIIANGNRPQIKRIMFGKMIDSINAI